MLLVCRRRRSRARRRLVPRDYSVQSHPRISQPEIDLIEQGGGLAQPRRRGEAPRQYPHLVGRAWLLSNRMLVGIYFGQYCITTLTWFFLTWFPVYLSQARHISIVKVGFLAALPALCGFAAAFWAALSPTDCCARAQPDIRAQSADRRRHAAGR